MKLEVIKRFLRLILPFPSVFKTPHWFLLSAFYILFGAVVNFFLPGALLVGSFVSVSVLFSGIVAIFRHREIGKVIEKPSLVIRKKGRLVEVEMAVRAGIKIAARMRVLTRDRRRRSRRAQLKELFKALVKPLIAVAIIAVLEIGFFIFVAPQLSKLLSDFLGYLASDSSALVTFVILALSTATCTIMLIVIFFRLPIDVIEEIDEEKLEFGILGTVLLTISDVLVLIEGMQGISVHYPRLISVAAVGMSLSVVCIVCSWAMCSFLLTKGIKRRTFLISYLH